MGVMDKEYGVNIIRGLQLCKPSDKPDDHLHTLADACRLIAAGYSPVSESGRVAIHGIADLLDYIAESEKGDLDSPMVGLVTQKGEPIKPDVEVIDRLNRVELPRAAALALQSIAITADYVDYSEVTSHVDLIDYIKRGGKPF